MQCDTVYFVKMIIQIMEKSSKYKIQQCQNGFLIYDPAETKQYILKNTGNSNSLILFTQRVPARRFPRPCCHLRITGGLVSHKHEPNGVFSHVKVSQLHHIHEIYKYCVR